MTKLGFRLIVYDSAFGNFSQVISYMIVPNLTRIDHFSLEFAGVEWTPFLRTLALEAPLEGLGASRPCKPKAMMVPLAIIVGLLVAFVSLISFF